MESAEIGRIREALSLALTPTGANTIKAEQIMEETSKSSSFVSSLLSIVVNQGYSLGERLAAASMIAKTLERESKDLERYDLGSLKATVVDLVTTSPPQIRAQLETAMGVLVKKEYPARWPGLLEQAITKIKTAQHTKELYGALRVIYNIFVVFKRLLWAERKALPYLIGQVFPFLENLLINGTKNPSPDFLPIINLLIKIFHCTIFIQLEESISAESLRIWIFGAKWAAELEPEKYGLNQPAMTWDQACDLSREPFFKMQKNALELLSKLAHHITFCRSSSGVQAEVIYEALPPLLSYSMGYLDRMAQASRKGQPVVESTVITGQHYKFIYYALQVHNTREFLRPEAVDQIVFKVLVHHLAASPHEGAAYAEDPGQFLLALKNIKHEPLFRVRLAAQDVLILANKYFDHLFERYLDFMARAAGDRESPPRFLEGLLFGLEGLVPYVGKRLSKSPEEFYRRVLLPCFDRREQFISARAASVLSTLGGPATEDPRVLESLCSALCRGLQDESLLLSLASLKAVGSVVVEEAPRTLLRSDLPHILDKAFSLLRTHSMNEAVSALKNLVSAFPGETRQFARELFARLLESFWSISENLDEVREDEADEGDQPERVDSLDAVESCLLALCQIVYTDIGPEAYRAIQPSVLNLLGKCFTEPRLHGVYDNILQLFVALLARCPEVDQDMWFFFAPIAYSILGPPKGNVTLVQTGLSPLQLDILRSAATLEHETLNIEIFLGAFGNFIQKSPTYFLQAVDPFGNPLIHFVFLTVDMLTKRGESERADFDLIFAVKLLSFIPENCLPILKNQVIIFENVLKYYASYLSLDRSKTLTKVVLEKICGLMFMDCSFFLLICKKTGLLEKFIYSLFGNIPLFSSSEERGMLILAITGLFSLSPEEFPSIIPMNSLVSEMLKNVVWLAQCKKDGMPKDEAEEDKDAQPNDNESSETDDSDESWNEENYIEEEEEIDYKDPLEITEPVVELRGALEKVEKTKPQFFVQIVGELKAEDSKLLAECFKIFEAKP